MPRPVHGKRRAGRPASMPRGKKLKRSKGFWAQRETYAPAKVDESEPSESENDEDGEGEEERPEYDRFVDVFASGKANKSDGEDEEDEDEEDEDDESGEIC